MTKVFDELQNIFGSKISFETGSQKIYSLFRIFQLTVISTSLPSLLYLILFEEIGVYLTLAHLLTSTVLIGELFWTNPILMKLEKDTPGSVIAQLILGPVIVMILTFAVLISGPLLIFG